MSSRDIKFRVWDTKGLKWRDDAFVRARDGDIQIYGYDSWEKAWTVWPLDSGRLVATQFTGLLDSKGREIWEGDILSYKDWHGRPFVVRWDMHHGNHSVGYFYGFAMPDRGFGPWEVIGNVFENSDLLK